MSKPEPYITAAAARIVLGPNVDTDLYTAAQLDAAVAQAVADERERLAVRAESRTDGWCSLTAEEIRQQPTPPTEPKP